MSGLDLLISAIVLVGLWRGFQAGFIKSILFLFGWLIALISGTRLADTVAPQMATIVQSPVLQLALAFLVVVLVVLAIIHLLAYLFSSLLKALKLSFLDKLAGGVLGAAKNILVVLVLLSVTAPILVQMPVWNSSILAQELMPYAPMAKVLTYELLGQAWNEINVP